MRYLWLVLPLVLAACGPSQKDINNTATITCNIMAESRNMDSAFRIKEINAAREKIGAEPYLGNDEQIKASILIGLCEELVKGDENYEIALMKDQMRQEAEVAAARQARAESIKKEQLLAEIQAKRAAAGVKLYEECIACHGPNGIGGIGPKLADRDAQEVMSQLIKLNSGETTSEQSQICAMLNKSHTDSDLGDLAAYIDTL